MSDRVTEPPAKKRRARPPATDRPEAGAGSRSTGVPDRPTPLDRPDRPTLAGSGGQAWGRRRLVLHRIDPWSVFVFSFAFSVLLALAIMVAAVLLVVLLGKLGVLRAVNDLVSEVQGSPVGAMQRRELLTTSRLLGGAAVLAAMDIVLLTALSTTLAVLYNACVALTGGIQVTVAEPPER